MKWVLYVMKERSNTRIKFEEYDSIVEAFKAGDALIKSAANPYKRYRVEQEGN